MQSSRGERHPFDKSCVEADMVAKVFGGIWVLSVARSQRIWSELFRAADLKVPIFRWESARVQISPYPKHHGGDGKEIGDVVILEPKTVNVVIEAKRPHCAASPSEEAAKRTRAIEVARDNCWPEPSFVCLVTEDCPIQGAKMLTWQQVADVFRAVDGDSSPVSKFVEQQIRVQSLAHDPRRTFNGFGEASAGSDQAFPEPAQREVVTAVAQRYAGQLGLEIKPKKSGYANLKLGGRTIAQLHCVHNGVAVAIPNAGNTIPRSCYLRTVDRQNLAGYKQRTCSDWLDGDQKYTFQPAVAFLLPEGLATKNDHPGWSDLDALIDWAANRNAHRLHPEPRSLV